MIINLLLGVLLLLGIAWIALGIAYLWRLFQDSTTQSGENNPNRKGNRQGERPKPSVSQEQIDNARHLLVGRSKPFVSPSISKVPAVSSTENPADNPNTFAAENSPVPEETEDAEGTEENNEMQRCRICCKAYGARSLWTISRRQRSSRRKTIKSYLLPFAKRRKRN